MKAYSKRIAQQAREVNRLPGPRVIVPLHGEFAHRFKLAPIAFPIDHTGCRIRRIDELARAAPFLEQRPMTYARFCRHLQDIVVVAFIFEGDSFGGPDGRARVRGLRLWTSAM